MRAIAAVIMLLLAAGCAGDGMPPSDAFVIVPANRPPHTVGADTFSVLVGGFLGDDQEEADRAALTYCAHRGKLNEFLGRFAVPGSELRAATYICREPLRAWLIDAAPPPTGGEEKLRK